MTLHERLDRAAAVVRARAKGLEPKVGIVLGSGLSAVADAVEGAHILPFGELPDLGLPSVQGHPGHLLLGTIAATPVAVLRGRLHPYEGWSAAEAAFPVRLLCWLGVRALVLTNAAGGIREDLRPGDLLLIEDHLNLSGSSPLEGPNDPSVGPRSPDLSRAYSPELRAEFQACASRLGVRLTRGVYAMMAGPSYETPAEIRMLRSLGADCVGMSTVPEVIAAAHQDVPVVALSCIANVAAGLGDARPLAHAEVEATVSGVVPTLVRLVTAFVPGAASM
jgi:purine-nucleoside phosphorylase